MQKTDSARWNYTEFYSKIRLMELHEALAYELEGADLRRLAEARRELTDLYRDRPPRLSPAHRQAYLATRMPATFAAIRAVLSAISQRIPTIAIQSLLDLGAGPGTAAWAACDLFPSLEKLHLMEREEGFIEMGQRLAQHSSSSALRSAEWQRGDLLRAELPTDFQMVLLSYSIGELPAHEILPFAEKCWRAAQEVLVIIEPGTPAGFERIRAIRAHLIALGAYPVAPCPHSVACPMQGGDWCHFSQRLERTRLHRLLKEGELGYEDEKFSYIALSKNPPQTTANARIVRHPTIRPGCVQFTLCTPLGQLEQKTLTKKSSENYKEAKKWRWGDCFSP
jgi:ribosomal protein RSM22 (predicted rRNA methylase)